MFFGRRSPTGQNRMDENMTTSRSTACLTLALSLALATGCAGVRGATTAPVPASEVSEIRRLADSLVADTMFRSAMWGILIVDPQRGDTLYGHNAGKLFIPASNQKILISSVALKQLGPDYRFTTTLGTTGPVTDGVVQGDLVITGTGDPTMSDHMAGDAMTPLRAIADSLAARGVRRITGALARSGDAFPGPAVGTSWPWGSLDSPSFAGVDELTFNEGLTRLVVRAGATEGQPASVTTGPARTFPRVTLQARTVAPRPQTEQLGPRRGRGGLRARPDSTDPSSIVVEGEIAAGDSVIITTTQREPSIAYLHALREALADKGIVVDGGVSRAVSPGASNTLLCVLSAPLREILGPFLKPSQNQIGEILLRALGKNGTGVGSPDSGARVVRDQVLAWGGNADGLIVHDGSGLSRNDMVTPETLVKVLSAMRSDTAFHVFYDAMPIAGVDGTIRTRMRDTPAMNNVRAKTGTLGGVRSLSGYVTTAGGRQLIFSMLANNFVVNVREIERVQDALAVKLATLP